MHGQFEYANALIPVYNNLFGRAQALMKRFNPCNVCDGLCERARRGLGKNFCCEGCLYLGLEGCRVKALRCALWVCKEELIHPNNLRAWNTEMWNIMITATEFNLLVARGSMEDSIAQACHIYTERKSQRAELMQAALDFKPAPLFFDNAIKPEAVRKIIPSFDAMSTAGYGLPKFMGGMRKVVAASDMSESEVATKEE